jgi:hypothetical protein
LANPRQQAVDLVDKIGGVGFESRGEHGLDGGGRYELHASQLFVWRQRLAAPAVREAPAFMPVVVDDGSAPG